jgi:PAS domain S-box-containing protein
MKKIRGVIRGSGTCGLVGLSLSKRHSQVDEMPETDPGAGRFPVVIADVDQIEETAAVMPGSDALVRSLLDTVPVLMWSANPDGELSYLNQQCVDYTGRTLKDFVNLGWTDLIHPDDLDETLKAWSDAVQTSSSYHVKYRLRRADGEVVPGAGTAIARRRRSRDPVLRPQLRH